MTQINAAFVGVCMFLVLMCAFVLGAEPPTMTKEAEAQGEAVEVEPDMEKLPPGWLSLDSSVGVLDYQVQKAKKKIEQSLFGGQMQLSGFLQTTYTTATTHPNSPANISIRSFFLDQNKLQFNAFNLTLERPLPDGDWGADQLAGNFDKLADPALFPEGSSSKTSRARTLVWENREQFAEKAKSSAAIARAIAAEAKAGQLEQVKASVNSLGKNTCTSCHKIFRKPRAKKGAF